MQFALLLELQIIAEAAPILRFPKPGAFDELKVGDGDKDSMNILGFKDGKWVAIVDTLPEIFVKAIVKIYNASLSRLLISGSSDSSFVELVGKTRDEDNAIQFGTFSRDEAERIQTAFQRSR